MAPPPIARLERDLPSSSRCLGNFQRMLKASRMRWKMEPFSWPHVSFVWTTTNEIYMGA
jgi:hypothetical protein